MKRIGSWMTAVCAAGALCLATTALAQAPGSPPQTVSSATVKVKATVLSVDQKTRHVLLKTDDGHEYTFVASDEVKNLAQLKKGDVVTTTYKQSLVYEVKKGGTASLDTTTAKLAARPGEMPAGIVQERSTLTVKITAIDPKAPSVTFVGPHGDTRTIMVQDPKKLQGVSVGDTVELVYTEAVMITAERAPKK